MDRNGVVFEVCLQSPDDAVAAEAGGAGRVELCAALVEGGITPSHAVIQQCRDAVAIDVMVMIRPRGGDFYYSEREVDAMHKDIEVCKKIGVTGVVFGALKADGTVARPLVQSLVETAGGLQTTFHRAFDVSSDPFASLDTLIDLGLTRVLTSGQKGTVPEGIQLIKRLVERSKGRIGILPGCGITVDNVRQVLDQTGVSEFHATAFARVPSPMRHRNNKVYMGTPGLPEYEREVTDAAVVRAFLAAAAEGD